MVCSFLVMSYLALVSGQFLLYFILSFKFLKNFIYLFIYLFLAVLGLRCCTRAFFSCIERGLLFVAACGLLIAVAALVVDHGL